LRAAGGVVRRGAIIRSDAPVALGSAGRRVLSEFAPTLAIDLREPVERELDRADFGGLGIEIRHVPVLGEDFDLRTAVSLEDVYRMVIETRGAQLTVAVRVLAEPGALPAIVYCTAGKDRTGMVVALALSALGVPDDQIVADYARSEQNMSARFRAVIEARARAAGISEQAVAAKVGAPPALMRETLARLKAHHGGAVGYLKAHGMTDAELAALRAGLVEARAANAA
jgi:protein-tyrosine phosphatase